MPDLVTLVFVVGFALVAMTAVLLVLAMRHDQVVSTAGPLRILQDIEAQIGWLRGEKAEIEAELNARREALMDLANVQAEIDAMIRQRDELLAEHATLAERKEEVRAMNAETEEAVVKFAEAKRDLDEKQEQLDAVQAKLDRADRLVSQIASMTEEHDSLAAKLAEMRDELGALREAKARAEELRATVEKLEREDARLAGSITSASEHLQSLVARADVEERRVAEAQSMHAEAAAKSQTLEAEIRRLTAQQTEFEDRRAMLEARVAHLKAEAARTAGGVDREGDPLKELKALPPVLEHLKEAPERARETEADALHRVETHMRAHGLEYPTRVIRAFHTAMKVNETTQMAVLAGISGTGKSQLPRRYAEAMGIGFLQVPVQPRWDSPQDLMGFYNYIEGRFRPTDMARALYHLDSQNGPAESEELRNRMMMVLLDEMNLARVEYYFSDFLSRLESRPAPAEIANDTLRKDSEIELEIPIPGESTPRIFPGYNVLFAGTMNEDESTQSLSEKVVDRANVLRFAAPRTIQQETGTGETVDFEALSFERWRGWTRGPESLGPDRQRVSESVAKMVDHMRRLHRPIGFRLGRAIQSYVANYPTTEGRPNTSVALADQVELRLLPKLRGVETETAGADLTALAEYVERDLADPGLATAITESIEQAEHGTGQFVWRGVTRG